MTQPPSQPPPNAGYSLRFLIITALFVTTLITSNVAAVKLVVLFGLTVSGGELVFPVSYIFGDVLTEVYGYSRARLVIWTGFACNLFFVFFVWAAGRLPAADFWHNQAAYDIILGVAPRMLCASLLAFLCGEFTNSYIMAKLKIRTSGRHLWLRTISSTVAGQALDTVIFVTIAFFGVIPGRALLVTLLHQWFFKCMFEALLTPLTYKAVGFLKNREGVDVYDRHTVFNPFYMFTPDK
ncbi:MAG: queuosine precursor transporter [Elusimicrobiaceae bacterium]|nr:queuosine precursor transporter [Elusimicrobiaceae bacterium]